MSKQETKNKWTFITYALGCISIALLLFQFYIAIYWNDPMNTAVIIAVIIYVLCFIARIINAKRF